MGAYGGRGAVGGALGGAQGAGEGRARQATARPPAATS